MKALVEAQTEAEAEEAEAEAGEEKEKERVIFRFLPRRYRREVIIGRYRRAPTLDRKSAGPLGPCGVRSQLLLS